jgi:hypothetical protein
MSLTYSSKGTPVMNFGQYQLTFTNTSGGPNDTWKWITVSKGGLKDVVRTSLDGLKVKIVPLKTRNRMKKVISKYAADGFIHKENLENIHNDLQTVLGESVVIKINNLLRLLG